MCICFQPLVAQNLRSIYTWPLKKGVCKVSVVVDRHLAENNYKICLNFRNSCVKRSQSRQDSQDFRGLNSRGEGCCSKWLLPRILFPIRRQTAADIRPQGLALPFWNSSSRNNSPFQAHSLILFSFIHPFICSFIRLSIHMSVCLFIHPYNKYVSYATSVLETQK